MKPRTTARSPSPASGRTERFKARGEKASTALDELYQRPGFLIRRAHQIAVSVFLEETGALGITNRQYGILLLLNEQPGIDQISVAKLLGLDRSTTGMVVDKLEKDGLVQRRALRSDRRKHSLALTRAGEAMLKRLIEPARPPQTRFPAVLAPGERTEFVRLLDKFVTALNESTRVPLTTNRVNGEEARRRVSGQRKPKSLRSE